ncbi:MAG: hypothetical protein ACTSUT_08900 [Promethearchaeota archaeon]
MGLLDLKKLKEEEYRIYLILIIWVLVGFTIYQFSELLPGSVIFDTIGAIIFLPLMGICIVFFLAALVSKKKIHEFSKKRILFHFIFAIPFIVLLVYIGVYLYWLALIYYIIITAFFTMYYFFKIGVKFENKIGASQSSLSRFFQWCLLVGGTICSVVIVIASVLILDFGLNYTIDSSTFNIYPIIVILIILIIFLSVIAGLLHLRGSLHSWLGIFLLGVAIYSAYLIYSVVSSAQVDSGSNIYSAPIRIALYFVDLILLLISFDSLLSEKFEFIARRFKLLGSDTIMIWLIFCTAAYQFAVGNPTMEIIFVKNIVVFLLFIPLLLFLGLYGLLKYGKKKEGKMEEESEMEDNPEQSD